MGIYFKKHLAVFITTILGAIVGYLYWYFYGCINGCTITGSPLNSTLYFAFLGFLLPGLFKKKTAVTTDRIN